MSNHLSKIHARIKFGSEDNFNSGLSKSSSSSSTEDQTLKFKHCKLTKALVSDELYGIDNDDINDLKFLYSRNESIHDFMNTLSDDDVITFYNSHLKSDRQCISVLNNQTLSLEKSKNRRDLFKSKFSYCVQFNTCYRRLPFICKFRHSPPSFSSSNLEKSNRSHLKAEFYPDTLRNYQQDPKMSYVINSLLAVSYGLDRIHQKFCNGTAGLCEKMKNLNGSELLENIKASTFSGITDENIYFDPNGDPPGR